jgi:hypothetical protein
MPWQAGVYWAREANGDLFAFTLDKPGVSSQLLRVTASYAISRDLMHWENRNATRADSETGRRYQRHEQMSASIMLFARFRAHDRAFWFSARQLCEARGSDADHLAAAVSTAGRLVRAVRRRGGVGSTSLASDVPD